MPGRKEDLREESLGEDPGATPEELAHVSNPTAAGNNGKVSSSPLSSCSQEEKGEDADEPEPRSPRESSVHLSVSDHRDRPQILKVEPNGWATASDSPAGPRRGACVGGEDGSSAGMATSSRKSPTLTPVTRDPACRHSGSLEGAASGGDRRRQQVERRAARESLNGIAGDNTSASRSETGKESRRARGASVHPCLSPSGQAEWTDEGPRGINSSDARAGVMRAPVAGVVSRVATNGSQNNGCTSVSYLDDFYMRQRTRAEYEAQRREEARREMTTWRGAPASKEFQWLQRLRHEQDESPASGSPGSATGPCAGPVSGRTFVGPLRASACGQADVWHRGDLSRKSPGEVIKRSATLPEETRLVKHLISLFQAGSTRRPSGRSGGAQSGEVRSPGLPREGTVPGPQVRPWGTFRTTSPPTSGSNEGVSPTAVKRSGYFSVRALGRTISFPRPSASSTCGGSVPGGSFGPTQECAGAQRASSRSTDCLRVPAYFSSDASSLVHGPWPAGEHASPRRVSVHSDPRSTSWAVPTHQTSAGIPTSSSSGTPGMSFPVFVTPRPTAASGPPRLSRQEVLVIQDALLRYQAVRQQGRPIQGVPNRGEYRRVPSASYSTLFGGAPGVGGTPGPIVYFPNGAVTFSPSQQRQHVVADAGGAGLSRQNTRESVAGNKGDVGVSKLERRGADAAGGEPLFERVETPTRSSEAIAEDPESFGARDEGGNREDDARKAEIEREEAKPLSAGRGAGARGEEGKTCGGDSRPATGEADVHEETQSAALQPRREERSTNADGTAEWSAGASIKDSVSVSQDESAKDKTWSDTEAAPVGEPAVTDQSTLVEAIEREASGPTTRRRVDARAVSVAVSTVSAFAGQQTAGEQEEGPPGAVTNWQTHEKALLCLADCFAAAAVGLEGCGRARAGHPALEVPEDSTERQECEGTSPPEEAVQFGLSGVLGASDSPPSDDVPQEDLKPYERIMLKFLQYREWWEAQTKSGGDGESQAVEELLSVFDANDEDGANDGERKHSLDANGEAQQLREIDAILESIPDLRRDIQLFGALDSFGASELAADAGLFNFKFAEKDAIHLFSEDEGEDEDIGEGGDEAPTDGRLSDGPKDPRESLARSLEVPLDAYSVQSALPGVGGEEDTEEVKRVASDTPISASALLRAHYLVGPLRVSHLAAGTAAGQRIGDSSSRPDANQDTQHGRQ
ncbi:UNVERIFIED_CONTAM: hypothetical protein HHA_318210 [Hammondia hammondi]|eukprot:XP_008885274.1 hypothetical protein HHA_318210 [Hammondia hammondi]